MDQLEPWVLFVRSSMTIFIISLAGLTLVNIRPSFKKIGIGALFFALIAVALRSQPWPLAIDLPILLALLILIIKCSSGLTLPQSLTSTLLGMLLIGLFEITLTPAIYRLFNISFIDLVQCNYILALLPLPQLIFTLLIVFICHRYDYYLFDFYHWDLLFSSSPNEKRVKVITFLSTCLLFLFVVHFVFGTNAFYLLPRRFVLDLNPGATTQIKNLAIVAAFLMMIALIQQLSVLLKLESEYMLQSAYISTQDELYTATRAEAHDRINHLQTLYGFVQLNNLQETRLYLEEMLGDIIESPQFIETGNPGLSSLFYIKSGLATAHGIQLEISMKCRVESISAPPYELSRILGNLINNSFDSVLNLDKEFRKVKIIVEDNGSCYIFHISNYGHIETKSLALVFSRGFSSKAGQHEGLGLYIVKKLVEKNRGSINVDNQGDWVVFKICLPKSIPT